MSNPYADAARLYWDAGWRGVLPLPPGRKWPPPDGWTGAGSPEPSWADVQAWLDAGVVTIGKHTHPVGNIALRLPDGVIGIDVDNYGDKGGGVTLLKLENEHGALPATWRTTSRTDGVSGIYLYRVPPGLRWPGVLGPGIEVVQRRHRYAVVWPSVHPEGSTYTWHHPQAASDGIDQVVSPDWLADLPDAWVQGITGGRLEADLQRADLNDVETLDVLRDWGASSNGEPCHAVRTVLDQHLAALRDRLGARHDAGVAATQAIAHLGAEGHRVGLAVVEYGGAWARAFKVDTNRRTEELTAEWQRMLTGAVQIAVAAHPDRPAVDPCLDPFRGILGPANAPDPRYGLDLNRPLDSIIDQGRVDRGETAFTAPTVPPGGPLLPPPQSDGGPAAATGEAAGPTTTEADRETLRAALLSKEAEILRARRGAARLLDDEEHASGWREPAFAADLSAELAIPDDPVRWRVEQLMPVGSNVLLSAQFKAGKTTLVNHLVAAVADGGMFLGAHTCHPVGRVGVWNLEVDRDQYRRWWRDVEVLKPQNIVLLTLRGLRMPLSNPRVQDWAIRWLAENNVTTWILDPFARAFQGESENNNSEVGRFLDTLDVVKEQAGVKELVMPTHTGRQVFEEGAERARGATRLNDWADVSWSLTIGDDKAARYLSANGRDVAFPEARLGYDEDHRRPFLVGASRAEHRAKALSQAVLNAVSAKPGIGSGELRRAVRTLVGAVDNRAVDLAIATTVDEGRIRVEVTPNATRHHPVDPFADIIPETDKEG